MEVVRSARSCQTSNACKLAGCREGEARSDLLAHSVREARIRTRYHLTLRDRIRRLVPWAVHALVAALAAPASAQDAAVVADCPAGRISHVFIDNHSIFDVDELGGGRFMRGFYGLANSLHVRTRRSFIERELLFHKGDCFDPLLLEESARILRGYVFIAGADIFAVRQADGTQHVVVDTQDEWTTRVDLGVSVDKGVHLEVLEVSEENVAGRGAQAAAFIRQRNERRDLGARLVLPRLFGTRTDGAISAGRTRDGSFFTQGIAYPFVGEVGRTALVERFQRRDELFPYAASGVGGEYSHLLLPFRDERFELSVARRWGRPGGLTLLGVGLSRESVRFRDFPGSLEIARNNDFGTTDPAPPGSAAIVDAQVRAASTTRLGFFVGRRNLSFATVRGLDALDGVQDVQLGTDVGLTVGRSVGLFSAAGDTATDDIYGRVRGYAGGGFGSSFLFVSGALDARRALSVGAGESRWRDVLAEADAYAYFRAAGLRAHTLFTRVSASGGWDMATPFQLTLGGRAGVRGLSEEAFPGARRVLLSVEDRILLRWPAPDALDFGLTCFADAGRIWAGSVPYGVDSGWRGAIGGGIRYGFPSGTRGVVRLDLAFPVGGSRGAGPIFRMTLYELLGLFPGFEDQDMARSRRLNLGPDSFTTDRR